MAAREHNKLGNVNTHISNNKENQSKVSPKLVHQQWSKSNMLERKILQERSLLKLNAGENVARSEIGESVRVGWCVERLSGGSSCKGTSPDERVAAV